MENHASLSWFLPIVSATVCWAFSDICSDFCIEQLPGSEEQPDSKASCEKSKARVVKKKNSSIRILPNTRKLCGEEKAFLSGAITFLFGCVGGASVTGLGDLSTAQPFEDNVLRYDLALLAVGAGAIHFISYYFTLKAYNSAPSTVITPLLQLSAVLMLPMSILAASLNLADRPVISLLHFQAVIFIVVGGFLPLADGDFSKFFRKEFWQHPALISCFIAELLVCAYNLILHYLIYGTKNENAVFVFSNMGNGIACLLLYIATSIDSTLWPDLDLSQDSKLIQDSKSIPIDKKYICIALSGEMLSLLGLWLGNLGYARFYEPAVVNAAEGGLQQMFNLMFALVMYRCMPSGRRITDVPVKILSFCFVSFGLYLTTC